MKTSDKTASPNGFHKIRSIEVVGGFLEGMHLEFEQNLNCLIGGRGTGKTTVLEMLRWTSDQMPGHVEDSDRLRDIDRLVHRNLGTGQITLGIETLHGIRYRVRRNYGERPLVLGDNGEPVEIDIGRGNIFRPRSTARTRLRTSPTTPCFS